MPKIRWLLVLAFCAAQRDVFAAPIDFHQKYELRIPGLAVAFVPENDADIRQLKAKVDNALAQPDDESKHERRGLAEISLLAKSILATPDSPARQKAERDLLEVVLAVNNLERPTVLPHFDAVMFPTFAKQLHRPIGVGKTPAADLVPGQGGDLSERDPLPNSFWSRPINIAGEDLSAGFGRASLPNFGSKVCQYYVPKESSGMNPGYEVQCDGSSVKLKFGEQSSEPFATRIFWALGYHSDPTDYSPGIKVAYDRRIFTEFNSRKAVRTKFTVLWLVPVYSMNLQGWHDPFDYVASAVLRDGTRWSGRELKHHLLDGTNFVAEVEKKIDYIVTTPANVQIKEAHVKSIGPWDYAQLDHADRREVRAAGLLAAWIGFYDTRFDNTKLRLVGPKKNPHLEHYFSDLGAGLGRTSGLMAWHGEKVNEFPIRFTAPSNGRLRIVGYTPVVPTKAFADMTLDDARWMARLIGQLTPEQITQALRASGYDDDTIRLYTAKLLTRRNYMMSDLGLASELATTHAPVTASK